MAPKEGRGGFSTRAGCELENRIPLSPLDKKATVVPERQLNLSIVREGDSNRVPAERSEEEAPRMAPQGDEAGFRREQDAS